MAEPILMPKLGFDMAEGTLIQWVVEIGQTISKGDVIAEIETDKATIEIESTVDGTVLQLLAQPGDVVAVGSSIGYVGAAGEAVPEVAVSSPVSVKSPEAAPAPQAEITVSAPAPVAGDGMIKASPIARRLAAEHGIDLRLVTGTGPGGRIVKQDVVRFQPATSPGTAAVPLTVLTVTDIPDGPDVEIIELSRLRARIGQRLVESKQLVPHFYVTTEIDMEAALKLRKLLNQAITDSAEKISVNDLVIKAAALTLRQFPNLNTHYYGDHLARYKRINIGIAVALPEGGLLNVTSYDADQTSLGTMARNHRDMIARAREGKVKPHEIEGGTFTVSNLGPYNVDHFIAIINPPEAGILAIGSAQQVPVVLEDGSLGVGTRMKATISVDHRVSDGAEAAEYMQALKEVLEQPLRLLL